MAASTGQGPGPPQPPRTKAVIMGAAGRDFHAFNVAFRDDPRYEVVAFTATQIPDIAGRLYPPSLSGPLYPLGIPILPEEELAALVKERGVDWAYFCYSDVSHMEVMHKASTVLAAGASFGLLGPAATYIKAGVPVVAVCAVRTGAGKSPTSRRVARHFLERGRKLAVIRHPMPYGDLERQASQRFATWEDLDRHDCTVEEREEYEPYIRMGVAVYAGVDYRLVVEEAQIEADLVLWDGGNNDFPFVRPDLHLVVLDPHRPGHEMAYHPGEVNFRLADAFIVNKVDSAVKEDLEAVLANAALVNPRAQVVLADSALKADRPDLIEGRRVVIVGDGPTLTHGGMSFGAGTLAARRWGAREVLEGGKYAVGSIREAYETYPHLKDEVPAMGYSPQQVRDLEATLNGAGADVIIDSTPVDLSRLLDVRAPIVQVEYELEERGDALSRLLTAFEDAHF